MALEIERKFLVNGNGYEKDFAFTREIKQGYLNLDIDRTVRIRMDGYEAFLTVKGRNDGNTRKEFEYEIPLLDAIEMLPMCGNSHIEKMRYIVPIKDVLIEVDVFGGANNGLIVAEIEFDKDDPRQDLSEGELQHHLPEWIGKEVSDDSRYFNSALILNPYNTWK